MNKAIHYHYIPRLITSNRNSHFKNDCWINNSGFSIFKDKLKNDDILIDIQLYILYPPLFLFIICYMTWNEHFKNWFKKSGHSIQWAHVIFCILHMRIESTDSDFFDHILNRKFWIMMFCKLLKLWVFSQKISVEAKKSWVFFTKSHSHC